MLQNFNKYIDHTLLKPDASIENITKLCNEALEYNFATVCINPVYVKTAGELLSTTDVGICSVVGFPLGSNLTEIKVVETQRAILDGATEIDMVINIGALKNQNYNTVLKDIREVVHLCKKNKVISKVIIETALLTKAEKIKVCELIQIAEADFVKTSTGFSIGGATIEDVELLHRLVSKKNIKVKAAGGIRTFDDAMKMIKGGASRIGSSSGVKIMEEMKKKE